MMRIAIISLTKQGNKKSLEIKNGFENAVCFTLPKWKDDRFMKIDGSLKDFCGDLFERFNALIFIMATGIVVRSIIPWIKDKTTDPAVIVIDDSGKHVISLLSGHLGGANALTTKLADLLDANPVITTASDINALNAVDVLAQKYGLLIDSMEMAKSITAKIVNNQKIGLVDNHYIIKDEAKDFAVDNTVDGKIIVSNRINVEETQPFVRLIPCNIVLGIGCKKDINPDSLWEFVCEVFAKYQVDLRSIFSIASISLKKNEGAIMVLGDRLNVALTFYTSEELKKVDHLFKGSDFVRNIAGVASVSTTAAYIAGKQSGNFIAMKEKKDGMTISIFEYYT